MSLSLAVISLLLMSVSAAADADQAFFQQARAGFSALLAATPAGVSAPCGEAEDACKRRTAIDAIRDRGATAAQLEAAFDVLNAQQHFSPEAASAVLAVLEQKERDGDLRASAAKCFYLVFYDPRGTQKDVLAFLARPGTRARVERLLLADGNPEVRNKLAQLFQVALNGFADPGLWAPLPHDPALTEKLASLAAPILVRGAADADPSFSNECVVALGAIKGTAFFKTPAFLEALRAAAVRQADPDMKQAILDLLAPQA